MDIADPAPPLQADAVFAQAVVAAMPVPTFLVDRDVRIHWMNRAAEEGFELMRGYADLRRGGDALHCLHHGETPEGCGHAEACKTCPIRSAVGGAFEGSDVWRSKVTLQRKTDHGVEDVHLRVTARRIRHEGTDFVLCMLEDISELINLKSFLRICMHCRKVHVSDESWEHLEAYLASRLDLSFSHGLCKECAKKHYPDHFE
jgi:PAS domain-containing protein